MKVTPRMNQQAWKKLQKRFEVLEARHNLTYAIIAADVALILLSYGLFRMGGAWTVLSSLCLLQALVHAYLWVHEATHSTISRRKWLNDLIGHLAGWLVVMPYLSRRRSHMMHHVWAGHPVQDPGNKRLLEAFSVMTEKEARKLERIWTYWIPALVVNDRVGLWRSAFKDRRAGIRTAHTTSEVRANYAYLAGYVALFALLISTHSLGSFVAWYVPVFIILMCFEELANGPHHAESPLLNPEDDALPYWEQHRVTHSCKSVGIWSRAVLLNFNLHTAHHMFPKLSWHILPLVQREVVQWLPELEAEQTTPNEIAWSLSRRRKPILKIMGHYFDRLPR